MLQKVLYQKFQEAVQKEKDKKNELEEEENKHFVKSFMGNINPFSKKSFFSGDPSGEVKSPDDEKKGKASTMRIPKVLAQNIIFNTISNFMFHFVNFKYSLENSKQVVLYFCKRYELD